MVKQLKKTLQIGRQTPKMQGVKIERSEKLKIENDLKRFPVVAIRRICYHELSLFRLRYFKRSPKCHLSRSKVQNGALKCTFDNWRYGRDRGELRDYLTTTCRKDKSLPSIKRMTVDLQRRGGLARKGDFRHGGCEVLM